MNLRRVLHILGLLLLVLGAAELIPLIWCFEEGQSQAALGFLCASATSAILGLVFRLLGHQQGDQGEITPGGITGNHHLPGFDARLL